MLRNIHFFNIKPGAGEERILWLWDHELAEYAKTFGCLERKTWKLLNAHSGGKVVPSAGYLNESLWPSRQAADAFSRAERPAGVKAWLDELSAGTDIERTLRYTDKDG
jgi:hypothetical protein